MRLVHAPDNVGKDIHLLHSVYRQMDVAIIFIGRKIEYIKILVILIEIPGDVLKVLIFLHQFIASLENLGAKELYRLARWICPL